MTYCLLLPYTHTHNAGPIVLEERGSWAVRSRADKVVKIGR